MFKKSDDRELVFIKSKNINVFPCGRRRSQVDTKNYSYIPFDPEARLNTEANNRKHSGLNGFSQSYIYDWTYNSNSGLLSIVLGGYLFNIILDKNYRIDKDLGIALETYFGNASSIFANIKLESVIFFSGTNEVPQATTEVLRDQLLNDEPAQCLDFFNGTDTNDANSFYFSGLTLSAQDLTDKKSGMISLQILAKDNGVWHIHYPSELPKIEHGDTKASIKIKGDFSVVAAAESGETGDVTVAGDLLVNGKISASEVDSIELKQNGHPVALLDIVEKTDTENAKTYYQLVFTGAVENKLLQ